MSELASQPLAGGIAAGDAGAVRRGEPSRRRSWIEVAGQWRLIWWRFRRHRLAVVSGVVVILIYLVALFAEFLAPLPADNYQRALHLRAAAAAALLPRHRRAAGASSLMSTASRSPVDPRSLARAFVLDEASVIPVGFFVKGDALQAARACSRWSVICWRRCEPTQPFYPGRRRPARPRRAQPRIDPRHAHLDVDRPRRRGLEPDARHPARRHLGLSTAAPSTTSSSA